LNVGCWRASIEEHLLQRGLLRERVLTPDDLRRAEAVYLINSVRGRIRAEVVR
jgi:para-aminobenzoate synthetase/4-amino-4-deoxychorismate lyase